MNIPTPSSLTGRVLIAMLDGVARSKVELALAIGVNENTDTTARVRDLRSMGFQIPHRETQRREGRTVFVYRLLPLTRAQVLRIRVNASVYAHIGITPSEVALKLNANIHDVRDQMTALCLTGYIAKAEQRPCAVTRKDDFTYYPAADLAAIQRELAA